MARAFKFAHKHVTPLALSQGKDFYRVKLLSCLSMGVPIQHVHVPTCIMTIDAVTMTDATQAS
jgi:hypothetical protein